jgi:hypothetical protein
MTPDELAAVGSSLFGPTWQTRLANALGVNDRTLRRWASGENAIPAYVRVELLVLCEKRREGIDHAIKILRGAI